MKQYIGTKIILAAPMTRGQFNFLDCIPMLQGDPQEPGYRVRYADGYQSWSPAAAFEEAYRESGAMNFGLAIEAMRKGLKVSRGALREQMWICLSPGGVVPAEKLWAPPNREYAEKQGDRSVQVLPYFTVKTPGGTIVPWVPNQTDMLAEDWSIVT